MPVKLGELLLKESMITPQQLEEALAHQKMNGGKLGKAFVTLGYVKDEEITSLLSRQYGVPSINLDHFEIDPLIIKIIPAETCRKYQNTAAVSLRSDADDRHGGPDQRVRDGRHQVHDGLQRRARGGIRVVARGCPRALLRLLALTPTRRAGRWPRWRWRSRRVAEAQGHDGGVGPHLRRHGVHWRPLGGRRRCDR